MGSAPLLTIVCMKPHKNVADTASSVYDRKTIGGAIVAGALAELDLNHIRPRSVKNVGSSREFAAINV